MSSPKPFGPNLIPLNCAQDMFAESKMTDGVAWQMLKHKDIKEEDRAQLSHLLIPEKLMPDTSCVEVRTRPRPPEAFLFLYLLMCYPCPLDLQLLCSIHRSNYALLAILSFENSTALLLVLIKRLVWQVHLQRSKA